jgi:hypothetical protein
LIHFVIIYNKKLLYNKKISNHNMAGGFDGMEVTTAVAHAASATQLKQECDGSYKS